MRRIEIAKRVGTWIGYALAVVGGLVIVSWATGWVEIAVPIVACGTLAALAGLCLMHLRGHGVSGWVGRRVVVGVNETVQVRDGDRVVAEDPGWPLHVWNVERVEGGRVRIRFEDSEMAGWVESRQVVLWEKAVPHYTGLLADSPSAWAYRRRAAIRYEKGDSEGAIQDYGEAIRLDPSDPIAYAGRGKARHARREYALTIEDFDRLIQLDPAEPEGYQGRGNAWFMLEDWARAIEDLSEAIRLDPTSARSFARRGDVYLLSDDPDRAISDFDEAIRLDRQAPELYWSRGVALGQKGEFVRSAASLTQAIHHSASPGPSYTFRGLAWQAIGEHGAAVADFTEAIGLGSNLSVSRIHRAKSLYHLNLYEEAVSDCEEVIRRDPTDPEAYWGRGLSRMVQGKYEEALADYDEAIRLDPADRIAHQCRAWLLATCPEERFRNGREAIASATRACELGGWGMTEDVAALAAAFAEAGEFDHAVETQRKVIDLAQNPEERAKAEERLASYAVEQPYRM
jgi:tetratricopeptide (TPR) repeat protein